MKPSSAVNPSQLWNWSCPGPTFPGQPGSGFDASPTVYNGIIYVGCDTGVFYAVSETTGSVVWNRMLGYVTNHTCSARGITSTATVAADPSTGTPTVYISGGDGNLYSLDAATGTVVWQSVIGTPSSTVNDYYDWSSPTVSNGHVYIGVSSQCDQPFVPGGVKEYDQHTGVLIGMYASSLPGAPGAGVWTSAAVGADGSVYVTTASGDKINPGDSYSIVRLADLGAGITKRDIWTIPVAEQVGDSDFGGSPTIFTANLPGSGPTEMVGACNKNGVYYAWRANQLSAGPVWTFQIGVGTPHGVAACLGAAIWDGSHLFAPGNATTINGTAYNGSVRELDPATGSPIWETGLPAIVLGSASKDAGGVIAAPTYGITGNGIYLIDAASGAVIHLVATGSAFAQPVFADTYLVLATGAGFLTVFAPNATQAGGITGTVADATAGGRPPIQGATVTCTCASGSTTTDSHGTYAFTGVASGTYSLTVSAPGYTAQTIKNVAVTSGNTTTQNVQLVAQPGGITGQVSDSQTAAGIVGATVTCTCSTSGTTSGTNGLYSLAGVTEGTYSMTFSATGYATQTIDNVTVTPGNTTTTDARLVAHPGAIGGQVTDAQTGGDIARATVICTCQSGRQTTDANGMYVFSSVPPGTYSLRIAAPSYIAHTIGTVAVTAGNTTTQNVQLVALPGGITGDVTDSQTATAIAGATVTCTCTRTSTTDSSGTYVLTGVARGTYSLTFSATGYVSETIDNVVITPATTTTLDTSLIAQPGAVTGHVTNAGTGGDVAGATVTCTCQNGSASTDQNGIYSFGGVPAGTYALTVTAAMFVTQTIEGIVVTAAATTTQDIRLVEQAGVHFATVDGSAHGDAAIAINDASIYVRPNNGGSFGASVSVSAIPFYGNRATLFAHLDGSGLPESAVAMSDHSIWVMKNSNGRFGTPTLWSMVPFYGSRATLMADVDGSGYDSAVAINDNCIWVMRVNSTRDGFMPPQLWSISPFYGSRGTFLADVDGNGRASAVAINDNSIWVMHSSGGAFGAPQLAASATFYGSRGVYMADLEGHGKASAVAINDSTIWVERNDGNGGFSAPVVISNEPFYGTWQYMADVDGSGRASAVAVSANGIWVKQIQNGQLGQSTEWFNGPFYGTH